MIVARPHVSFLAIDAGQTGIKARVSRADGQTEDYLYPGVRTNEPLLPQLARVTEAIHAGLPESFEAVAYGVSGLTGADSDARSILSLVDRFGVREAHLAHDSVTSFLGSLGHQHGAVIAAGTGAVTLGVGATRVARVDGWGNIMGDAGSGYWIGRRALELAMRSYDGREVPTALVDILRERWPDIEDAYVDLQSDPDRVSIVASLSEAVTSLAPTDPIAAQITAEASHELAHSVLTALASVQGPQSDRELVTAIGGVFRSESIRARFEKLVTQARPQAHIEPARGSGLDGAASLLTLPPQHPLSAHVLVARSG
ncbi:N-acetylglucosamine kinase [Microbacterium marmarense]|uniref:BadF/BadG/BcrA/BcrD ATPase family protein n=1 Tax=Microbacterium marmarense TaxID=3122051 RepID=A0ABU8LSM2_9MICO